MLIKPQELLCAVDGTVRKRLCPCFKKKNKKTQKRLRCDPVVLLLDIQIFSRKWKQDQELKMFMWKSEVCSFLYHAGLKVYTQVVELGSKHPYLLKPYYKPSILLRFNTSWLVFICHTLWTKCWDDSYSILKRCAYVYMVDLGHGSRKLK